MQQAPSDEDPLDLRVAPRLAGRRRLGSLLHIMPSDVIARVIPTEIHISLGIIEDTSPGCARLQCTYALSSCSQEPINLQES
jgi:hypothetical protein